MFGKWTAMAAVVMLAACAQAPDSGPIIDPPDPRPKVSKTIQPRKGHYKVGPPYTIRGVTYTPQVDYRYDTEGEASWYGGYFHGRLTANGEVYDQNSMTAAHPTLPLPSIVRVTNLDNGRAVVLRVNDRGPFAQGRILDVSRKAAKMLGFQRKGVTRVRVQILERESRDLAKKYGVIHDAEAELAVPAKPTS